MALFPEAARAAISRALSRLIWTLAPDGTIWEGSSSELRLIHRTLEGDTLRIIETRHRPPEFTPAEQAQVDEALRALGTDTEFRPRVLQAIHVLDDGHVLAQISGEFDAIGDTVDVFDPEGRFLGSMGLPFAPDPLGLVATRGDTIVAVTQGELDVPYVVRAVIERR